MRPKSQVPPRQEEVDYHAMAAPMSNSPLSFGPSNCRPRNSLQPGQEVPLKAAHTVRLEAVLADTPSGRIWQGLWLEAHLPVALKTVHPGCPVGSVAWQVQAQQLQREAELLARWRDPSVLALWAWASLPSGPVLMLERLDESLHARHARSPATRQEALRLSLQAAQAVAKLHLVGLKHLDVKPANFLMRAPTPGWPPRLLLADFGCCQPLSLTHHAPMGSPGWAAPEALRPDAQGLAHTGTQTDVYALGLLVFGLLVGRLPQQAQAVIQHYRDHHAQALARPWAPPPLAAQASKNPLAPEDQQALAQALTHPGLLAVVCECLRQDPTERLDSTTPLIGALEQALRAGV